MCVVFLPNEITPVGVTETLVIQNIPTLPLFAMPLFELAAKFQQKPWSDHSTHKSITISFFYQ